MFVGLSSKAEQLGQLGNVLSSFGDKFSSIGQTLTNGLTRPIMNFGTKAAETFFSFEQRIRKVNATFGGASEDMNSQFEKLSESARKYGRETEWTAEQVGEAYEYMAMALNIRSVRR